MLNSPMKRPNRSSLIKIVKLVSKNHVKVYNRSSQPFEKNVGSMIYWMNTVISGN